MKMPFKQEGSTVFIAIGEKEGHMVGDAELYVASGENHASVVQTVVSRALRLVNRSLIII